MENLKADIKKADHLTNNQKETLYNAFDAVKMKDIQQQGIDQLDLDVDKIYRYEKAMIGVLRALSVNGVSEVLGHERVAEIGVLVEDLMTCFKVWDDDCMKNLLIIKDIHDYGDHDGKKMEDLKLFMS